LTAVALPSIDDDEWELYDTTTDWSQARDLAGEFPERLEELKRLFLIEAVKYGVLPLDDRRVERFNPDLAGRPTLIRGNRQLLFQGMGRLTESSLLNVKNKSHAISAQFTVPAEGATGVLVAQGGAFGGWSLYLRERVPAYCYNLFGMTRFHVEATDPVPPGAHQLRAEFVYDGGGFGKGGDVMLYLDGHQIAEGRVDATVPMVFSLRSRLSRRSRRWASSLGHGTFFDRRPLCAAISAALAAIRSSSVIRCHRVPRRAPLRRT
jgi:arylsulfatase